MRGSTALDYEHLSIQEKILHECVVMVKYATSSGLSVSPELMEKLQSIVDEELGDSDDNSNVPALKSNHAADLTEMHGELSEIVAPATPRAILLFEDSYDRPGILTIFGPVGLVQRMLILGIIFLVTLVGLALSGEVNADELAKGIFQSDGLKLLFNLLFLISASGLGAVFANLVQANRFIGTTTYDPKYEASYWIRLVLGLMAGLMLAELIPIDFAAAVGGGAGEGASVSGGAGETASGSGGTGEDVPEGGSLVEGAPVVIKPLLAILGGFSASAVYRILSRLVDAIESIVRGDTKDIIDAQVQTAKAQGEQQLDQAKLSVASEITKLQQKVGANADPDEIKADLEKIVSDLLSRNRGRS